MISVDLVHEHCRNSMMADVEEMLATHQMRLTPRRRAALMTLTVEALSELLRRLSETLNDDEIAALFETLEAAESWTNPKAAAEPQTAQSERWRCYA